MEKSWKGQDDLAEDLIAGVSGQSPRLGVLMPTLP